MESAYPIAKLQRLAQIIAGAPDSFYGRRLSGLWDRFSTAEAFRTLPFTTKEELVADHAEHRPFGSNFTQPATQYTRFCQTSGTSTGMPMAVLDTPDSWQSMLTCWRQVFRSAGLLPGVDRVMFAFSFGPFLGFWTAFEASAQDYLSIPSGGLSSTARLEMLARYQATVLCCTPTYALRLGENIGVHSGVNLSQLNVKKIIVAGEAGGSLPPTRERLRQLWGGAEVYDHHGMTEVGPVSYEDPAFPASLCVIEDAYYAEIVDALGNEVEDGAEGELVLTTLNRTACPLIRYRTGDWVCKRREGGRLILEGGILTRCDDMVVIRGVNVYPSAVENLVRRSPEVAEFLVLQKRIHDMDELEVQVELYPEHSQEMAEVIRRRLETRLRDAFTLRMAVTLVAEMVLPRHEFKSRRWQRPE